MPQDTHQRAKERYADAREKMREQHARMREDLKFSNPSDPQQWDKLALDLRKGRPCLTFDKTNQFISQVVNDARQNKPSIRCLPADSKADVAVAEKINGIVRHIEYVSRAGIAYDTAIEHAARIGLGWLRVVPEVMRPETNEQEIRIKRVHDPLSICLDADSTEPDGSDATDGFAETDLGEKAFAALYPKAKVDSFDGEWFGEKTVRVCEWFEIVEEKENRIAIEIDGTTTTISEDEYWETAKKIGFKPPVVAQFEAKKRKVMWRKLNGCEVLEETEFPSQYIPLIPVMGDEVWLDGKRYLCGMTRKLRDGQRFHNLERSAFIESLALQPKAPYMAATEAIEGFEEDWARLNQGNPAYLPYNARDANGNEIPAPARQMPPQYPVAFAQGGEISLRDMEGGVGMYRSNLGAQSNAVSGKAKLQDKREGDTANFHYIDNLSRSIEQLGRVVVDMIPRIYDTKRQARIIGEDGEQDFVTIDPEMEQAVAKQGKKIVAINLNVGAYDVRVKAGPSYTSLRQESAEQLAEIIRAAPDLMPIIGDIWVRAQDWPEAEKVAQRLKTLQPPAIQELEAEDGPDIPPEVQVQMQSMQQQLAQMQEMLQQAGMELQKANADKQAAQFAAQKAGIAQAQSALKAEFVGAQRQLDQQAAQGAAQTQPQQPQQAQPQQPQGSYVVMDTNGQLSGSLQEIAAQNQSLGAAVEALAQGQAVIAETDQALAQTVETLAQGQASISQAVAMLAQQATATKQIEFVREGGKVLGAKTSDGRVIELLRDDSGRAVGAVTH